MDVSVAFDQNEPISILSQSTPGCRVAALSSWSTTGPRAGARVSAARRTARPGRGSTPASAPATATSPTTRTSTTAPSTPGTELPWFRTYYITKLFCVRRVWDSSQCACVCRATCSPGQELEPGTCTCLPRAVSSQCALAPVSLATSHPAKIATYVGLVALTVLGLTIAVTLYYIVIR